MDADVAPVEELLAAVASSSTQEPARRDGRVLTTHAVWLCACETFDDAPTWLIYAVGDDAIGWERVPEGPGVDVPDVVEAEHLTGGHPSPGQVLDWLVGRERRPWHRQSGADFPEHDYIYEEISRRLQVARAE